MQNPHYKQIKNKKSPGKSYYVLDNENNLNNSLGFRHCYEGDSVLPPILRTRLHDLFTQVEREFEMLYSENLSSGKYTKIPPSPTIYSLLTSGGLNPATIHCITTMPTAVLIVQEKIDVLREKLMEKDPVACDRQLDSEILDNSASKFYLNKGKGSTHKLKTTHKLKAQTSKIVSSFKGPTVNSSVVRAFTGHKDGIWDVCVARQGQPLVGTASADHTACVWSTESGRCLLQYQGHGGSVNSIRFHPSKDLVLTASGDQTAHVWQAVVAWEQQKIHSSDEDLPSYEKDEVDDIKGPSLRTPVKEFTGHSAVLSAADWMAGGNEVITASWDRTACLFNLETGELVQTLGGHDLELTHTSAHPVQSLVVTSSKDTTFRLWDFRDPIHSVSVFQGHTETVTCAVFTKEDKVVSGSDDRSVKVWDLRNMRSPFASIASDSAVNRLGVSAAGVIAIPYDNRQVRLYDLSGQRLARLSRTNRQGHRRMVTSVAWMDDPNASCHLFSCGFDRILLGWAIHFASKE